MKKPLVFFCISMILGIVCGAYTMSIVYILLCVFVLGITLLALNFTKDNKFIVIGILIFFTAGALNYLYNYYNTRDRYDEFYGKKVYLEGFVDSIPQYKDKRSVFNIKTEVVKLIGDNKSQNIAGKIRLTIYGEGTQKYNYGDSIKVYGVINVPSGKANFWGFDYSKYLLQSGTSATMFVYGRDAIKGKKYQGNFFIRIGLGIRERIVNVINKSLPPQQAGLLNGMLIGYREGLTEEVQNLFSDAGLSHIMAVSGANIAFIVFPLIFIFKKIRINGKTGNVAIILILIIFTFITGFEPSVLRAVIMASVILVGQIIEREPEIYTSISFAAILLLIINPFNIFNIGFQLSFAATISLVMFYKNIKSMINIKIIPEFIKDTFAATMAAQLGVLPISVFFFNKISLVSVITNLIVVPVVGYISIIGCLMAIFGQISLWISIYLGYLNNTLLSFVLYMSKVWGSFPLAVIKIATPSLFLIGLYYVLLTYFLWFRIEYKYRISTRNYLIALAGILIALFIKIMIPGNLEVVFVDVGQGDCAVIKTHKGKTVLIDGGGNKEGSKSLANIGHTVVIPFLLDYGITSIDMIIGSHSHNDHIGGLVPVMSEFNVKTFVIPYLKSEEGFKDILQVAQTTKVDIQRLGRGDVINLDNKTIIEVLHPDKNKYIEKEALNNNSLVLKLQYDQTSFLFTGDIEKEAEKIILEGTDNLRVDVLKVPHHGSDTSSTYDFIQGVKPAVCIISVGRNEFGHPSQKVLDVFESLKIKHLRTDINGGIMVYTNGRNIKIKTTK